MGHKIAQRGPAGLSPAIHSNAFVPSLSLYHSLTHVSWDRLPNELLAPKALGSAWRVSRGCYRRLLKLHELGFLTRTRAGL